MPDAIQLPVRWMGSSTMSVQRETTKKSSMPAGARCRAGVRRALNTWVRRVWRVWRVWAKDACRGRGVLVGAGFQGKPSEQALEEIQTRFG